MTMWLQLLLELAPMILRSVRVPVAVIPAVVDGIQNAEAMPGATGAEKKAHVLGIVSDAVGVLNTTATRGSLDAAATAATVSSGIDATIGAINLIHSVRAA